MNHKGLTPKEVEESREKWGANELTPPKRVSLVKLFLEKFSDPIIRILIIAAIFSFVISISHNDYTETIGILVAIFLATGIGFWFEVDANRKFEVLNSLGDQSPVRVVRNFIVVEIPKSEVVVGDIVLIESGEEIAADGVLIESQLLRVNESSLTGESSATKTTIAEQFKADATYRSDMVLRGTTVLEGNGIFRVEKVGDETEIGKVATASTIESGEKTPLTKQLDKLSKIIGVLGFSLALITFFAFLLGDIFSHESDYHFSELWLLSTVIITLFVLAANFVMPIVNDARELIYGSDVEEKRLKFSTSLIASIIVLVVMLSVGRFVFDVDPLSATSWISMDRVGVILSYFMVAVTMIVVAVPEGLPMSVTLSLALNMRRMLKSNNLVRKMHACETMGAITVVCTDKTGTLTKNQMSVQKIFFSDFDRDRETIFEGISLNSTAHLDFTFSAPSPIGNPTESALLLWLRDSGSDYRGYRDSVKVLDRVPFTTELKYMATKVASVAVNGKSVIYLKGAPEIVASFTTNAPNDLNQNLVECQNRAMRTLAFAYKIVDETGDIKADIDSKEFDFLGFTAIADPIRDDVPEAIMQTLGAGVAVKIVTGDTPSTAKEIARRIGLWNDNEDGDINHISGVEFGALTDDELLNRVQKIKIMSRARPTDKQRLVKLLQQCGEVVAVTGDGTNDAPALNFAHVGLSMGSGTSVAKEASDITLIDDSFASVVTAIRWGRSLYRNIQRFILFQLTINVIAVLTLLVSSFTGIEPPLTITQMLWINIIMDTFAAAALASLPSSNDVMREKPRRENDFIITPKMRCNIFSVASVMVVILMGLLYYIHHSDINSEYGMTLFFSIFVLMQFWNMFNAKVFGSNNDSAFKQLSQSKPFMFVALLILVGQILIVNFGGDMFRTIPLSVNDWVVIVLSTSLVLWIGEVYRFIKRKLK